MLKNAFSLSLVLPLSFAALASGAAFAHPGGNTLSCQSIKGAKQKISLSLHRMNAVGWAAPTASIAIDGKKYDYAPTDEMKNFGVTIHDSPLGLIYVSGEFDDSPASQLYFEVKAIPATVRVYDENGKLVKWSLQKEKAQCYDAFGKAKFRAILGGSIQSQPVGGTVSIEPAYVNCTLDYDPGMAC